MAWNILTVQKSGKIQTFRDLDLNTAQRVIANSVPRSGVGFPEYIHNPWPRKARYIADSYFGEDALSAIYKLGRSRTYLNYEAPDFFTHIEVWSDDGTKPSVETIWPFPDDFAEMIIGAAGTIRDERIGLAREVERWVERGRPPHGFDYGDFTYYPDRTL